MNTFSKYFLILISITIILIGLSYGLMPNKSLPFIYNFEVTHINSLHILRAIMCLYIGIGAYWIYNTIKKRYYIAYESMLVFMYGLALGRIISLVADGIPHWIFINYLVCEIILGTIALFYLIKHKKEQRT